MHRLLLLWLRAISLNYLIRYFTRFAFRKLCIMNWQFLANPIPIVLCNGQKKKIVSARNTTAIAALSLTLDLGEAEALSLYWEVNADFLLIDEKRGRIIAQRNGVHVIGTIGVLLFARQKGLIANIKSVLNTLSHNGFHISDALYHKILERAGEL